MEKYEASIIKTYEKGKKLYYSKTITIVTIANIILAYLFSLLLDINFSSLSTMDYLLVLFGIGTLYFINRNIFMPIMFDWDRIEHKYQELMENSKEDELNTNYITKF